MLKMCISYLFMWNKACYLFCNLKLKFCQFLQRASSTGETVFTKEGWGLSWWLKGKESSCQCRRPRFDLWSGMIPHAAEQLSPEPQLLSLCSGAREPQLPSLHNYWSPCTLEPALHNKRSHHNEKPPSTPRGKLKLEKSPRSNEDPAPPKINKYTHRRKQEGCSTAQFFVQKLGVTFMYQSSLLSSLGIQPRNRQDSPSLKSIIY